MDLGSEEFETQKGAPQFGEVLPKWGVVYYEGEKKEFIAYVPP